MQQLKTNTIAIRSPRVRSKWNWTLALRDVGDIAHMTESVADVRAAVDEARAAFIANARKFKIEIDLYEFNSSISNILFNTGFHRDRHGNVHKLSDLISLDRTRPLCEQHGRACVRYSISARLEDGSTVSSRETLDWLDEHGDLVADDKYSARHPEALLEIARALDAYATDVEQVVRQKLERLLALIREHSA